MNTRAILLMLTLLSSVGCGQTMPPSARTPNAYGLTDSRALVMQAGKYAYNDELSYCSSPASFIQKQRAALAENNKGCDFKVISDQAADVKCVWKEDPEASCVNVYEARMFAELANDSDWFSVKLQSRVYRQCGDTIRQAEASVKNGDVFLESPALVDLGTKCDEYRPASGAPDGQPGGTNGSLVSPSQ